MQEVGGGGVLRISGRGDWWAPGTPLLVSHLSVSYNTGHRNQVCAKVVYMPLCQIPLQHPC